MNCASQDQHLQQKAETLYKAGHLMKEREEPDQYHQQRFVKALLKLEKAGIFDDRYR